MGGYNVINKSLGSVWYLLNVIKKKNSTIVCLGLTHLISFFPHCNILFRLISIYEWIFSMTVGALASVATEYIFTPISSPLFYCLLWFWVFCCNSFRAPSSSTVPFQVFLVWLKILLFYPLNLISADLIPLTQFHWPTNLSSPLTSLLLFSFSSGSFGANANADAHLSSHALFSLAVQLMYKSCTKTHPERMSELQVNTQKLWNVKIKISSTSKNKPLYKREDKRWFNNSSVGKVFQFLP